MQQHFPRIRPDQYAEKVGKPGFFEGAEAFATKSVTNAMNQLAADIEKVNRSIDQAKQNELQKTAAPAINALIQKSNARLSQAENALLLLGYRLDQHGNPINILEERKEAIKAAISNILPKSRSIDFFQEEHANKGIKIIASKNDQETIGRNRYQVAVFKDGKGEPISSRDLGPDFMTSSILKKIEDNMQAEQQKESILKSKKAYDLNLSKIFKEHNGNTSDVSIYLKNLKIEDIVDMVNAFGKPHGDAGVTYIRGRIVEDMEKNELQLKRDKEQLNKEAYDLGIKRDRGYRIG